MKQEAEELGIEVKGKDAQKLQEEIHDKKLFQTAEALDLKTDNKSNRELFDEIITEHAEEAKDKQLFPFEKRNGDFFWNHHVKQRP